MKFRWLESSLFDVSGLRCAISARLMKRSSRLAGLVYKYFNLLLAATIIISSSLFLLILVNIHLFPIK